MLIQGGLTATLVAASSNAIPTRVQYWSTLWQINLASEPSTLSPPYTPSMDDERFWQIFTLTNLLCEPKVYLLILCIDKR